MHVHILVTIPRPELFKQCTLVFNTLRTGFPTADITVYDNANKEWPDILRLSKDVGANIANYPHRKHLADWIYEVVEAAEDNEPTIILDADIIFWSNCEGFSFEQVIAGMYIPKIWNEWAQCESWKRIHTSFLWISSPIKLKEAIAKAYPLALKEKGDYCPVSPFHPRVMFVHGTPYFWDCCSVLFNMIACGRFEEKHLDYYDHINSASFYDEMLERVEDKEAFKIMHKQAVENPNSMKGFYKAVRNYYIRMQLKLDEKPS